MSNLYHYELYPQPGPVRAPVVDLPARLTDQQPVSTPVVVIAWVTTALFGLYLLPWAIAATRGKANQWTVFVVSLFLGWTGVGWIVALVLACTRHRPQAALSPGLGYAAALSSGPGYAPALSPGVGYAPIAALPPATPPAGWYPNPGGPGRRYWDGYEWTGHCD